MDKIKDLANKVGGKGGSSGGSAGGKGPEDQYVNKGVDLATDKLGLGDKYDTKIGDQANKQVDKQLGK